MVFNPFSSNIDEVLPINVSADMFVLGDFSIHHNDVIISEMFYGRISLNSVLLLLLVNFVNGFRLELM